MARWNRARQGPKHWHQWPQGPPARPNSRAHQKQPPLRQTQVKLPNTFKSGPHSVAGAPGRKIAHKVKPGWISSDIATSPSVASAFQAASGPQFGRTSPGKPRVANLLVMPKRSLALRVRSADPRVQHTFTGRPGPAHALQLAHRANRIAAASSANQTGILSSSSTGDMHRERRMLLHSDEAPSQQSTLK
jgi:hypothetical protein